MAKVQGPLFSFAASGKLNVISYASQAGTCHVRKAPHVYGKPVTEGQTAVRDRVKDAAAEWALQDGLTKDDWKAKGIRVYPAGRRGSVFVLHHGWDLWLQEWWIQGSGPGSPPMLPA